MNLVRDGKKEKRRTRRKGRVHVFGVNLTQNPCLASDGPAGRRGDLSAIRTKRRRPARGKKRT